MKIGNEKARNLSIYNRRFRAFFVCKSVQKMVQQSVAQKQDGTNEEGNEEWNFSSRLFQEKQ